MDKMAEENKLVNEEGNYSSVSVEKNEELQTDILGELKKMQKKTLMYTRITSILMLVFVIAVLCVVPSLLKTLEAVRVTLDGVNEAVVEANTAISQAEDTMKDLSDFVATAGTDLNDVVDSIQKVDFDSLNKAIKNLDATVEPFANFFSRF
ncbi:MAG: hypothetical protein IK123_03455 [Lachnospiraceae bacterium]|nr:hypothetical protein [Lachnospiraceae bacterium]